MNIHLTIAAAVALLLCFSFAEAGRVKLKGNDVQYATDIEEAIEVATNGGTEHGTVVLDGSKGAFKYAEAERPQRSIHIKHSNVKLLGVNGAVIINCADGIFFGEDGVSQYHDSITVRNIEIVRIGFICNGHSGVRGSTLAHNVTLKGNYIQDNIGIDVKKATNWLVAHNKIVTPIPQRPCINIGQAIDVVIRNNDLQTPLDTVSGSSGITIGQFGYSSHGLEVRKNRITAYSGMYLPRAANCTIIENKFCLLQGSAIILDEPSDGNRVIGNVGLSTSERFELVSIYNNDANAQVMITQNVDNDISACSYPFEYGAHEPRASQHV